MSADMKDESSDAGLPMGEPDVLCSLLTVGAGLAGEPDRRKMLGTILREARHLAYAESGSLYIHQDGALRFVACQNDKLSLPEIFRDLLDSRTPVSAGSLAGYVAATGKVINLPDAYALSGDEPFHHNRQFDDRTGYRTVSILAIPLHTPDRTCVGVLQLINRLSPEGGVVAFPESESDGILSLAAMAAVTIHNVLLQDQLRKAHLESIIRLSTAAEFKDPDTAHHIQRVSDNSAILARAAGLNAQQADLMRYASPMHDIGKIGIPDAILLKPGRLTEDELRVMQGHSRIGATILRDPQNELMCMARDVALWHHERWDGQGYPEKIAGENIALSARIVRLTDTFDALVSRRCYKEPISAQTAVDMICKEKGTAFDPTLCERFLGCIKEIMATYQASPPD